MQSLVKHSAGTQLKFVLVKTLGLFIRSIKSLSFSVAGLLVLILPCISMAAGSPPMSNSDLFLSKFSPHREMMSRELAKTWPTAPFISVFPAQIEQESCVSAKSKMCWSPLAELKTFDTVTGKPIEYGFGWGQVTIAYNKAGGERFNSFKDALKLDPSMANWKWENRYDAAYQFRAIVLMDRQRYNQFEWAVLDNERMAFALAAYNGGTGGVLADRAICKATPGCAPGRWFNHVENTSNKNRKVVAGYGQSSFDINRGYVRNIMCLRHVKYAEAMGDKSVVICPAKKDAP